MSSIEPLKRGRPPKVKYTDEQWEQAKTLVIEQPHLPMAEVARIVNVPVTTLESRAVRLGWLDARDINDVALVNDKLQNIIQQISLQISDQNAYLVGMVEGLQNSYRIKIIRSLDGSVHFRNYTDYPGRPENWNSLTSIEQDALLNYIPPARYIRFVEDLFKMLNYKMNLITFIAKFIKGSLPKVDVFALNFSQRDSDNAIVDDVPVISILAADKEQEQSSD